MYLAPTRECWTRLYFKWRAVGPPGRSCRGFPLVLRVCYVIGLRMVAAQCELAALSLCVILHAIQGRFPLGVIYGGVTVCVLVVIVCD